MNITRTIILFFAVAILLNCQRKDAKPEVAELNLTLSKEIDKMAALDKQMQLNMMQFAGGDEQELANVEKIRQQVYEKHSQRILEIVKEFGYPSYDIVGKKSTENFNTLIKHASEFQDIRLEILEKLREKRKSSNISLEFYVSLADELAREQGKPTEYGTIIDFNNIGQAYLKGFDNFETVDSNRLDIGLDSIRNHLNLATYQYFKQNEKALQKEGITKPTFY